MTSEAPVPDDARPRAGDQVGGRYTLKKRIAAGGMGEVWRARNEATGADVAVKILHDRDDDAARGRMRAEARLGATLSHRNIVRIFDLLEERTGDLVLVMELLRGESLAHALERREPLSVREAVAVAVPILSALDHAHAAGIVHRDVTPANVFLCVDPDGFVTPKLVDFGIAKIPGSATTPSSAAHPSPHTLPGSVLGTPRYMSPEQIRGAELDGRSDLFSVAAVVYEMLTGASPFAAEIPSAALAAVLESPVDPDPRIEPRVWLELSRALAKRPYERHASAAELARALEAAVGETAATLPGFLRRDPPGMEGPDEPNAPSSSTVTVEGQSLEAHVPARRRFRAAFAAVAVLAAAVVVLAAGLVRSRGQGSGEAPGSAAVAPATLPALPSPSASSAEVRDAPAPSVAASTAPSARARETPGPPPRRPTPDPAPRRSARPSPTAVATTPGF